ncbi:hypothetical protein L2E82_41099 [Cichorium intybus]|uniref:Uncharacterized protein n=1 Tax=Cichorium intybus TaxID=13427 RepID=A0ACB9AP89_CICIN|nr:hypothetical protein L2E82_41099 [Cichorium intybus]
MSWQAYVDDHLMCDIEGNHLSAAAIIGLDGSIWAQSSNFPTNLQLNEPVVGNYYPAHRLHLLLLAAVGLDSSKPGELEDDMASLQAEVQKLSMEEHKLDENIRKMQERMSDLSEDNSNQKWLFNETLIAIKAPLGITLEVPDPDEVCHYDSMCDEGDAVDS